MLACIQYIPPIHATIHATIHANTSYAYWHVLRCNTCQFVHIAITDVVNKTCKRINCSSHRNPIELLHFRDFGCFSMQCDPTGNHSEDDHVDRHACRRIRVLHSDNGKWALHPNYQIIMITYRNDSERFTLVHPARSNFAHITGRCRVFSPTIKGRKISDIFPSFSSWVSGLLALRVTSHTTRSSHSYATFESKPTGCKSSVTPTWEIGHTASSAPVKRI